METQNISALQSSPLGAGGQDFKHVSYLWDDEKAAALGDDQVALLIYRSNLLGADLRLTNYGGGNTSCKAMAPDPLLLRSCPVSPVMACTLKGRGEWS